MKALETIGLAALRRIDPETAHGLALKALNTGLGPRSGPVTSTRLKTDVAGLSLPNPVLIPRSSSSMRLSSRPQKASCLPF